jgi:diguanylate cyclase (GGDEF)-like protein
MMQMAGWDLVGEHCYDYFYGCKAKECHRCKPHSQESYFTETYDEKRGMWYEVQYNDIIWVDGKEVSLCSINDVTDKKKYQQRIEFQANNDFLTGLYNRMRCEEDLQLLVDEAEQTHREGALLFIDLDDFKHINDGLGHQYGDALLKMIASSLRSIRGIENRCYRVGGDEFVIIIEPEYYDMYNEITEEIQKIFSSPWYLGKNEYYCTMSMGVLTFPSSGRDVNDLIKKADIAMYDAKKNGKNGSRLYNEGEDENQYIKLDIEKNMRSSVAAGCHEFEVYIQPIVDIHSERCIGGEALIRWNSKELGFLMPGEFIPLAEHLGLINSIGEYVLRTACGISKKWSDMGINVRINVNLSVIQLLDNNIVNIIREAIETSGIDPKNLVLEVTESLAINDMNRMKEVIKQIKELGVKIALDDFGTGYSSLNYIKQMDLDIIKVDRTFIKDISEDDYAQAFVKLIADLSKQLEVQVCVEGVEERQQLDTLKTMNINMIQGFYYGKPMQVESFEKNFLGI